VTDHPTRRTPAPLSRLIPNGVPGACTPEDRAARLLSETMISLAQAAKLFPPTRRNKAVHVSTILRWILDGSRGVRLEAVRAGSRWITSVEAVSRYLADSTARHPSQLVADTRPVGAAEQRRHERVEERLRRMGI